MSQFDTRWTPISANEGGYVDLPLRSGFELFVNEMNTQGFILPAGANGMWIGAERDFRFRFNTPVASTAGLLVYGGTVLEIPNKALMNALLLEDISAGSIGVQFFRGHVGGRVQQNIFGATIAEI